MAIDMAAEAARLDGQRQRLESAKAAYADAQRALLASDGATPIYGETEHAKRSQAARDAFREKLANIGQQADEVIASIEAARLSPHADPMAGLGFIETETAVKHRVFVAEDCEALSIADLVGRLEWVRSKGDKGLEALYARYGARRFKSLLNTDPQPDGLPELRAVLEKMGAVGHTRGLSPELQELRFKADAVKRQAAYALEPGSGKKGTGKPMGL